MDIKNYVLLFILFLIVRSQSFGKVLSKIKWTIGSDGMPNNYSTILQGIFLVISFIIVEALVNHELL